ncbi:aldo/keto reductase [Kordiimonas sp. SCSIO 12603]|uniref:aldo/keto reductase n=1 Tax=Kordiimonas sp. SCSIO 12603 TaxID=2829596 RepID=UPI002103BA9E|nr:aldo/keto reductase [Kordiimonas sp. SCSIO 12603]UTW57105.1 aldo/keto reductase [Kordiimonas sp. SCSIO 12603]
MEMRKLGRTGISVSKICLGTMTWGEQNTEAEGHAQIDMALEYGVNFLDTAELYSVPARKETYGATERVLGSWLKKTGKRDKVVIASKVAGPGENLKYMRPHLHRNGRNDLSYDAVIEACDASLERLGTDYIDLYQIHWPSRPTNFFGKLRYRQPKTDDSVPLEETLSAMKTLVDAGKIRAVGLSNETAWGTMHALNLADTKGLPRVASVQNPYNLLNRSYEVGLAEVSEREDCGLLAYSPLASGFLTGKYCDGARPEGARLTRWGGTFGRYLNEAGTAAMEEYVALARKHGIDPAQMANAFVNMQTFLTSNIIGATSLEQLKTALDTHDMVLPKELMKEIDAIETKYPMPCP